jgi:hypothetical protein
MLKTFDITVDLETQTAYNKFSVSQGDLNSIALTLNLTQDGKPVDLTGCTVRMVVRKPSGKTIIKDCPVVIPTNGSCTVLLGTQASVEIGTYTAELYIYNNDSVAVSGVFTYSSRETILDDEHVESQNDWQAIHSAIGEAREILDYLESNGTGIDAEARKDITEINNTLTDKADLDAVRDKYTKIELEDLSQTTLGAMAGNATFSLLSVPQDYSVTPEKTVFLEKGKNLFNKDAKQRGYVSYVNGQIVIAPEPEYNVYEASEFILVTPNTQYTRNYSHQMAFYDANKVFISGTNSSAGATPTTFTTPANAKYMRLSVREDFVDKFQVEKGTASTYYEPYGYIAPKLAMRDTQFTGIRNDLRENKIPAEWLSQTKLSGNLFNKDTATPNSFIAYMTGAVTTPHASYASTDFIEVDGTKQYHISGGLKTQHFAFFDENMLYITSATNAITNPFTPPANAKFVRLTIDMVSLNTGLMLEAVAGENLTTYRPYGEFTIERQVLNEVQRSQALAIAESASVSIQGSQEATIGKNLFNKDVVTLNKYVNHTSGVLTDNTTYVASDYIAIEPNTAYIANFQMRMFAFYTEAKVYISGAENLSTFTTPANAKFVRVTARTDHYITFQLEKGTVITGFEPFGYKLKGLLPAENEAGKDDFLLFLPSEVCVAVGRTIELYNKQVSWTGNIENYHFKWECGVGEALTRKWSCKGTAGNIGSYPMTLKVYDNNMIEVARATSTVKIVDATIVNPTAILPIGDSLTNNKMWLRELRTLSTDKIRFVGTRWNGDTQGGYFNHEGRSGASAGWYLGNSTYTFETNGATSGNPFYNPTTSMFDFGYYKSTYNITPNVVQLYLGTNGISLDPTTNVNNIKAIVDGIRANDANIKIFVVFTLYRGDQNGIGRQNNSDGFTTTSGYKLEEDRKVYNLMVKLNETLKDYTNLHFIPIALAHDSEYNFGAEEVPVNPRATQTEKMHVEATHPQLQGYLQMADIMFSTYATHLT